MINQLPLWAELMFLLSVLFSLFYFYVSNAKPSKMLLLIIVYGTIQSLLSYSGFYLVQETTPPRFLLVLVPLVLCILIGLLPISLRWVSQARNLKISSFIHVVRIPVEIVLHQLFIAGLIPQLMTFEGRNFDILVGISAPIIGFLYLKEKVGKKFMITWNIIGLFFVLFIVINAVLSIETPLQQFAFDQPNKGVLYFPYVLLPVIIVPIVIYTHITDIIKLLRG